MARFHNRKGPILRKLLCNTDFDVTEPSESGGLTSFLYWSIGVLRVVVLYCSIVLCM